MSCRPIVCFAFFLTFLFPPPLHGQMKSPVPLLTRLSRQAGYIFSGTVLSVERIPPKTQNDAAAAQMEEGHGDWAEKQRTQIKQMGLENYLTIQPAGATS